MAPTTRCGPSPAGERDTIQCCSTTTQSGCRRRSPPLRSLAPHVVARGLISGERAALQWPIALPAFGVRLLALVDDGRCRGTSGGDRAASSEQEIPAGSVKAPA